jgi:glutathione S-transferase
MKLYFSPLACSMAARIALTEAGLSAEFIEVDLHAKRTRDGADFLAVNPMGQVPVLRTDDGALISENSAVLQAIAELAPAAGLLPPSGMERSMVQQWLSFTGTEIHKQIFGTLFDGKAPAEAKAYVRSAKVPLRMNVLHAHLRGREFLGKTFSVADAYLATVLNWSQFAELDLKPWPNVVAYHRRLMQRPSIAQAFALELPLFQAQQKA